MTNKNVPFWMTRVAHWLAPGLRAAVPSCPGSASECARYKTIFSAEKSLSNIVSGLIAAAAN
jgi:hypothetical protein